jgi:hypothetical protein
MELKKHFFAEYACVFLHKETLISFLVRVPSVSKAKLPKTEGKRANWSAKNSKK